MRPPLLGRVGVSSFDFKLSINAPRDNDVCDVCGCLTPTFVGLIHTIQYAHFCFCFFVFKPYKHIQIRENINIPSLPSLLVSVAAPAAAVCTFSIGSR